MCSSVGILNVQGGFENNSKSSLLTGNGIICEVWGYGSASELCTHCMCMFTCVRWCACSILDPRPTTTALLRATWQRVGAGLWGGWVFKRGSSVHRNERRSREASGIRRSRPTMRCLPRTHSKPSTPHSFQHDSEQKAELESGETALIPAPGLLQQVHYLCGVGRVEGLGVWLH